jgi:hypothetical protein
MIKLPTYVTLPALAALLVFGSTLSLAATAYRWVDEQGVVHIQDQPHPGAEEIELGSPQTYHDTKSATSYAATHASGQNSGQNAPAAALTCRVTQPADDAVLYEVESVTVSVDVQPALPQGAHVSLTFDGGTLPGSGGSSFVINPIERGTHTVVAVVQDAASKTLCTSPAVTFNIRQPGLRRR